MEKIFSMVSVLGLLVGIILVRLSVHEDSAESHGLQCPA